MHPDCFTLSLPYPDERPARHDLYMARRLFPMYIGDGGELGSVSGYLYAALRCERCNPHLSEIFDTVAQTELRHLRLLGQLIRDLGADPFIRTRVETARIPPETVGCPRTLRMLLEMSLHGEQTAADHYRYLIKQTDDRAVSALLERILLDEEQHITLFSNLLHG